MSSHPVTKQDIWVLDQHPMPGTFCEVGAYDGITHSNTSLLEDRGWKGMLIEACPEYYENCMRLRPNSYCINAAIAGSEINDTLYVGGQYSGLDCFMTDENHLEHKRRNNKSTQVTTELLYKYVQQVDYLSIDTEGGEDYTLEQWFLAGGECKLLTVEFNYDSKKFERLVKMCNRFRMSLEEVRGFDLCFKSWDFNLPWVYHENQ